MSYKEELIKKLREFKFIDSSIFDLIVSDEAFITIPIKSELESRKIISENERMQILEDDVRQLKRDFNVYLKPEFKEESNRVFISTISKYDDVKSVYMKPNGNYIKYYIVYKSDDYIDFLDKILDIELHIEDSYPMIKFEFIHIDVKDINQLNLTGFYTVHTKEEYNHAITTVA